MPHDAVFQGLHFRYGAKDGSVLIESKKTHMDQDHRCVTCNQSIGEKTVRFYYWLLVDGVFKLVHASARPRLKDTAAINEQLFRPSAVYP